MAGPFVWFDLRTKAHGFSPGSRMGVYLPAGPSAGGCSSGAVFALFQPRS